MPANFPEIWLDRVIQNLDNTHQAPWLQGIAELEADVTELGQGTAVESNLIHVATTDFEVDVLLNNTTYPIPVQLYEDGTLSFKLDKYQTKVVTVSDDQTMGASYDIIDTVTKNVVKGIPKLKYARAMHSIAPLKHTQDTPVLRLTGGIEKLQDQKGRFRLTYEDLVALKDACDKGNFPEQGRRLVLCNNHWNDLLLDRKNFGNQLVNYIKGNPAPVIAGFELYQYLSMPKYDASSTKKAYGAIEQDTDLTASVVFHPIGIAKKTGLTKQYFVASKDNPSRQANELAYRHYFLTTPFRNQYIGAII